ncbi:ammonia-dependent NAD(+) synthetase [Geopseudomonas aromaticivorans]
METNTAQLEIRTAQRTIAATLGVNPDLKSDADLHAEIARRIDFIKGIAREARVQSLVLGISGGVDSLTAGLLCQASVRQLREEGVEIRFIAMRLPYQEQHDEEDAQACLMAIRPDQIETVNIGEAVAGLMDYTALPVAASASKYDFVRGNVKARMRMIAQYAMANLSNGLVIGTDHAAEAVMGFFTKHGDGACDLAPLSGLTKGQVRRIALLLGAPEDLAYKVPTADLEDLAPGKPDEMAYGCTYEEIDRFLLGEPVGEATAQLILAQYRKTAHKRALPYAPV